MLIDELRHKKALLSRIAKKYGATDLKVFGSVSRGEERDDSDIDILVSLPRGYDIFKQRIALQEELESVLKKNIDLVIRHELNKHIEATILNEARSL